MESGSGALKQDSEDVLEKVLMCARRVVMSTDAKFDFVQVKVADALSGASVSLWCYVPDIYAVMQNRIPLEEYFNRMVLEMSPSTEDGDAKTRAVIWDHPLNFEQFVAKQIMLRVRRESPVGLEVREDLSDPKTLTMIIDNWESIKLQGDSQTTKVRDMFEKASRSVVAGYNFRGFQGAILKDANGVAVNAWRL